MIQTRTNVYDFHFHLVFVTKYRKSIFDTESKREELKSLLYNFADKNGTTIEVVEIMPDHVHMVLSIPALKNLVKYRQMNIIDFVHRFFSRSSTVAFPYLLEQVTTEATS